MERSSICTVCARSRPRSQSHLKQTFSQEWSASAGGDGGYLRARFRVTIDGKAPGADHGVDTGADGYGTITEERLNQLIRQHGISQDRTFRIEFLVPGVQAYSFTFG
jgi:hypothetical protein